VATGRQPFVDFFVPFFQKNAGAKSEIKRTIAEGDLVVLHVLSKIDAKDTGRAVVDIFRVEDGKIVEHWDVMQAVPEKAANPNTMF
jgi:predicted SnoaL-like aldol condensation-catalyzing enzyme